MGRRKAANIEVEPEEVAQYIITRKASLNQTGEHFGISKDYVRYYLNCLEGNNPGVFQKAKEALQEAAYNSRQILLGNYEERDIDVRSTILKNAETIIKNRCMIGSMVNRSSQWSMVKLGLTERLRQIDEVLYTEVQQILLEIYLNGTSPFPNWRDRVYTELHLMVEENLSISEVAQRIGVSYVTLYPDLNLRAVRVDGAMASIVLSRINKRERKDMGYELCSDLKANSIYEETDMMYYSTHRPDLELPDLKLRSDIIYVSRLG